MNGLRIPSMAFDGDSCGPCISVFDLQLRNDECDYLIALADATKKTSNRSDDRVRLDPSHSRVVMDVCQRLAALAKLPVESADALHVFRAGEQTSSRSAASDSPLVFQHIVGYGNRQAPAADQSAAVVTTVIGFLRDDTESGETVFPSLGIRITGKRGRVIVAQTCYSDSEISHPRDHCDFQSNAVDNTWLLRLDFHSARAAPGRNATRQFVFLSNRATRNFSDALTPLGARAYQAGDRNIDFLYFDTYGGKCPPADVEIHFSLMDRQRTVPLDNKALLAKRLIAAGVCDPMVYLDIESVPNDPDKLWYTKDPLASAGRSVRVVRRHEIAKCFQPGHIIQEAVTDVKLIDGKKFTVRVYVLVWDGRLYLFPEGILVIHGPKYDAKSTDLAVQVDHRGYDDPRSDVKMGVLSSLADHEQFLRHIGGSAPAVFGAFADSLTDAATRYCLFGLDYLVRSNGSAALIEVNDRPNLKHTNEINQRVNVEMIRDMVALVAGSELAVGDHDQQRFVEIGKLRH